MLFKNIENQIKKLDETSISVERQNIAQPLVDYIQSRVDSKQEIRLNFICTHNSRRSHLSQVWAQTLAHYFDIKNVFCYSGGTETTALFPMAAKTLENTGFEIEVIADGSNPIYAIKYAADAHPILGFSKKFDSNFNPNSNFVAVLTCSSADKECPYIPNAEVRIPMTFEDPKAFDNTPQQAEKYNERSLQIATELMYVFSKIKL
ncbi:MAG: low molecular weight phosphatase family protein [Flavobacteriaceae bacterium]